MENINNIIKDLIFGLSPRQKDIIEQRFGLNGKRRTLAAVGKKYGLTRERVRQIESAGLKLISEKLKKIRQPAE